MGVPRQVGGPSIWEISVQTRRAKPKEFKMAALDSTITAPPLRTPLRLLLVEDSDADAELVVEELRRGGYEPTWERVDTATALTAALARQQWEVITCDWVMPRFSACAALQLIQEQGVDVPIIIVSGEVGEDVAVTAMKAGACDYVGKHKLTRLCPAIERELKDAEGRRARKAAEQRLRESEAELRRLMTSISDYLWSADVNARGQCRYRYFSPVVEKITGHPPEFYLDGPERWLGTTHPEDRPRLAHATNRLLTGQSDHEEEEYRILRPDETTRWVRDSVTVTRLEEGRFRLDGVVSDITERKRAEEALRESEERFRRVTENAYDLIAGLDGHGQLLYVSPSYRDVLGYDPSELWGTLCLDLVHPDDRGVVLAMQAASAANAVFRLRHKSQEWRWFEATSKEFSTASGERHQVIISRDITERRRIEEALRASEQKYRDLVETAHDVIWCVDAAGRFTFVNRAVREQLGYEPEEIVGRPFADFISARQRERAVDLFAHAKAGYSRLGYEVELLRKDGVSVVVDVNAVVLRDEGGNAVGASGTFVDVTARKRAEAVLRHSEQHFRSLIENSMDLFSILDGDGTIRYASLSQERASGWKPEEFVGKNASEFVHPDDVPRMKQLLIEAVHNRRHPVSAEYRWRHKDGSWRIVESAGINLLDDPVVAGILVQTRDITERKRAEQTLS
jgi:PAS domain S-box-containing protein